MKRIVLHIDRLVLRGFAREDRDAIAEGLRAELGRLLATSGAAQTLTAQPGVPRLRIPTLRIAPGTPAAAVGKQTAQGIVRRLAP